jgi:O-acetyl-ADP-ribose deacetylase (regulator of RNase III)
MAKITVVEGDITAQAVDVVVNAANRSLLGGGGVDGAIHRRGGPRILAECRRIREERYPDGLPVGHAVTTTGGDLPAPHVIHVVGPVYGREHDAPSLLASCHTEALRLADEMGARSIAFPAISTGAYGYPLEEAATVAIGAVRGAETGLEEIRFVVFDAEAHEAFRKALPPPGDEASNPSAPGSG